MKTTLTTLRSSRCAGAGATPSGLPHSEQNFAVAAFSAPQAGHAPMLRESMRARAGQPGRPASGRSGASDP